MLEIYTAHTFTELISVIQNSRRRGTVKYSYRHLANMLGYRSPRTLAMVHKGQRLPNHNLVRRIIHYFNFSPFEIEFTFLLVEKAIAEKKNLPTILIEEKINSLKKIAKEKVSLPHSSVTLDESIYLAECDLESARLMLTQFLSELVSKYSSDEPSTRHRYKIQLRLYIDNSQ